MTPRYPEIFIHLRSQNPLAAVSAVRHAMRRVGIDRAEIDRFCEQALAHDLGAARRVCEAWARLDLEE